MPIGDIQLTAAAIPTDDEQQQKPGSQAGGVVLGEKPEPSSGTPAELEDTALPREQVEQFLWEVMEQPAWRREADRCADFYDGNQLTQEDLETLRDRQQPALITNIIKPTVDTVLGMEAKSRTDWRVRPEDDESCSDELAEALSLKLKHAEIRSRADRAASDAYAAQMKAGLGWVEVQRERDPFKAPFRVKYVHRREIHWDWRAEQSDLSDARYLIRRRWLDLDQAIAMMPRYASLLRLCTSAWSGFDPLTETDTGLQQSFAVERDTRMESTDWRDIHRQRVCLSEIWYRKWVVGFVATTPSGDTIEIDFNNPRHVEGIVAGVLQPRRAPFQRVRLAWYAGPHFLYDIPSPYKHRHFPYVPFFGYREDLTGAPYGLVRSMLSPQIEVNARKSKMLWALNSRRVIADSDAVKDHSVAAAEVARSDAYIILSKDRKPTSAFKVEPGGELALQQFQVMQEAKQEISEASGIHKSMQGQQSGASSGLAINSLIEQGMSTLAEINDNFRFARRLVGEQLFELVQQSLADKPSTVTIGEGKKKKVVQLNALTVDETGQQVIVNEVSRAKAEIVLDDVPSTPTYRLQQQQMLTEITKALPPQLQAFVIDFIVEATDYPKRHELADRLRAAAGIQDEEQQAKAAQAQQQQQAQAAEMQAKAFVLEMAEKAGKIRKLAAEAEKIMADTAATQAAAVAPTEAPGSAPEAPIHEPEVVPA